MKTRPSQFGIIALAAGLLFTSCGGGGGGSPPPAPRGLTLTTASIGDATAGQPYTQSLHATGGTPPYLWSLATSSNLPVGLALSPQGVISGTPTSTGSFNFSVQVADSAAHTATGTLTLKINPGPLTITTDSLPNGIAGQSYNQVLTATGGTPPYSWGLASGSDPLPPGLALSSGGTISGTLSATLDSGWLFDFIVQATDASSQQSIRGLRIIVLMPLVINQASFPNGNIGTRYDGCIDASGGISYPRYNWSLTPDSQPLPAGLSFENQTFSACIRGTPTQSGTFNLRIQVTDSGSPQQTETGTIRLFIDNQLYFPPSTLPIGVVGRTYQAGAPTVYGGTPPFTWKIVSSALPAGLALNSMTGEIAGLPEEPASTYLELAVTDSSNPPESTTSSVYLMINPPVAFYTDRINDAVQDVSYDARVDVQWGKPPYMLRLVAGALPPGLVLNSSTSEGESFHISGTPTTLGQYGFTLEATDSSSPPTVATKGYSVRVVTQIKMLTTSIPEGWTGEPYTATLNAEGGVPPYFWDYCHDCIQPELTVDASSGLISGTPKTAFNQTVYFEVRDSTNPGQYDFKWLLLRIIGRLTISTSRLPSGRPDVPYRVQMGLWGGTPPYTLGMTSGSLPAGLTLDLTSWQITGTPTAEGTSSFTVKVTDTGPPVQTTSKALSLTIKNDLGRNDSPATATPISNGTFRASLSPYSDPLDGPAVPDTDYYALTANPGAVVTVETMANRLVPASPMDSVIEIVDAAGNRLSTCRPGQDSYGYFSQPCLNDDFDSYNTLDSKLYFQVPDALGTPATFYVHVLDWSGNARPDFVYDLIVFGAN